MQTLKLADDLFPKIGDGSKSINIRRGRRDIQLGKLIFEGVEDETLQEEVEVVEVRYVRIYGVEDYICEMNDFDNWVDFYQGMKRFYPDLDVSEECTIIFFE